MKLRNVSILALAISCCALALPLQDSASQDGGAPRERERERGGRGGRGSMPLPPDWPRAGGFGPNAQGGERPMIEGLVIEGLLPGSFGRRELNDDDLARAVAVAREVSPEWGEAIEVRIKQDSAQVKLALRTSGRRLLGLVALKERAPKVYEAKVAELRAQAECDRLFGKVGEIQAELGTDGEAYVAAKSALESAAARQVDATIEARRRELDALEERMTKLRADVEADAARRKELAEEVVKRLESRREQRGAARE